MFIHTVDEEISMRMLNAGDAEDLFAITDRSRTYLREWLPWLDETKTVDDSLAFIMGGFRIYAELTGMTSGIFYKDKLVGIAGFNTFDWRNRIGVMGYWLDVEHQGHGIITRVARSLTDYAFEEYNLNRVEIRVAVGNTKSQAIPKRLGYVREGVLRQAEWLYDHYVDHIVYSILKSEWEER